MCIRQNSVIYYLQGSRCALASYMSSGIARETQTLNRVKLILGAWQLTEVHKLSAAL